VINIVISYLKGERWGKGKIKYYNTAGFPDDTRAVVKYGK
jgi:hypothetical protein